MERSPCTPPHPEFSKDTKEHDLITTKLNKLPSSSSRAFQRHQEHDLITTKQNKLPSIIDRLIGKLVLEEEISWFTSSHSSQWHRLHWCKFHVMGSMSHLHTNVYGMRLDQ
jgi:hypothetical protein